jgi:hypothetical protein
MRFTFLEKCVSAGVALQRKGADYCESDKCYELLQRMALLEEQKWS